MSSYPSGIPSSFDPALLYSELDYPQDAPPSLSYSDDIDALQQCITEDANKKTSEGVVIQYRAWKLTDVFRSEGEASIGTGCSKTCMTTSNMLRHPRQIQTALAG
jgi:chromosome transmission fidelity protein 18